MVSIMFGIKSKLLTMANASPLPCVKCHCLKPSLHRRFLLHPTPPPSSSFLLPGAQAVTCPSHMPSLLSPRDLALAPSSVWNTPLISRTGSCSPFRSQLKCHHFKKPFADHLTYSIPRSLHHWVLFCCPELTVMQNTLLVLCLRTCCLNYSVRSVKTRIWLFLAVRTVSRIACLWKKGRLERREGRRKGGKQRGREGGKSFTKPPCPSGCLLISEIYVFKN